MVIVGYYALMVGYGIGRSFFMSNVVPTCMEVSKPSQGVTTYMTQLVTDGVGSLAGSYLAGII